MKEDQRRDHKLRRRLTLSHGGRPFLDRWGIVHDRIGGVYVHHIAAADPGMDLHDHPWAFTSLIVRGGYTEQTMATRHASETAAVAESYPDTCGPTRRTWGFYLPAGWVNWRRYPYDVRRPLTVDRDSRSVKP